MDVEYIVTETISRDEYGKYVQLDYQFEETTVVEAPTTARSGITRQNREKRNRIYDATITRNQYQMIARSQPNPLPFDSFVTVLRPFIMGFYSSDELERAFNILDRNHTGYINIIELGSFLPVLNDNVDTEVLKGYIKKVDSNFDGRLSFDEFRALVLRGVGRDIICNHL